MISTSKRSSSSGFVHTMNPSSPSSSRSRFNPNSDIINGKLFQAPTTKTISRFDDRESSPDQDFDPSADENESVTRSNADQEDQSIPPRTPFPVRHGFHPLNAEEQKELHDPFGYSYFSEKRNQSPGPSPDHQRLEPLQDWRMRERLKTVSVALVLCLNIGVDPPDVVKTDPCAKLECWVDPTPLLAQKALEAIGKNLQQQYEVWQPRARYRLALDPSVEEMKKICCNLRRNAKEERILLHYNGHGVPKPTASGELWVFNKDYTQYIPVSLYDLQSWLGSPCIFVYDCSSAGHILLNFNRFAEQKDKERGNPNTQQQQQQQGTARTGGSALMKDCIQLAACGPNDTLPMSPDQPADMFTACLTTPIEIALRWFVLRNTMLTNISVDMVMKLPGRLNDRRTPLGELNWIFTSITDTIAWNVLPQDLFKRLFRQDLMVAALFRNFLLADRIMRSHHCTPMSSPALPPTHQHPMWNSWDLAMDMCLAQLPELLANEGEKSGSEGESAPRVAYQHSTFFAEQLTAFEVWLATQGSLTQKAPEQLPIVLQVLLSQVHRLRALILLSKFLDLGPWAVNLALAVGIFPYVLKLLQSPAADLKPVLIFIWARILAVDRTCQSDLIKDNGYCYFTTVLAPQPGVPNDHIAEHRAMCAFILSTFCTNFQAGQQACLRAGVLQSCLVHMTDPDPLLRQWVCLCVGRMWNGYGDAQWAGIRELAHEKLCHLITDTVPEVRAAALYALGTFLGGIERTEQVLQIEHHIAIHLLACLSDGSHMVRREYVITFSKFVHLYEKKLIAAACELLEAEREQRSHTLDERRWREGAPRISALGDSSTTIHSGAIGASRRLRDRLSHGQEGGETTTAAYVEAVNSSMFSCLWKLLLQLSVDPHHEVSGVAQLVVDAVVTELLDSPYAESVHDTDTSHPAGQKNFTIPASAAASCDSGAFASTSAATSHDDPVSAAAAATASFGDLQLANLTLDRRTALKISSTMKRSSSLTFSIKNLYALGTGQSATTPPPHTPTTSTFPIDFNTHSSPSSYGGSLLRTHSMVALRPGSVRQSEMSGNTSDGTKVNPSTDTGDHPALNGSLPLTSSIWEWSAEYFAEPQMKAEEKDEPGSVVYNQRLWRKGRNERVYNDNERIWRKGVESKWDSPPSILHNGSEPSSLLFHKYEPHLIVAGDRDGISVWNWEQRERINMFSNSNSLGSKITTLQFVNEHDKASMLVGSSDGIVRIYKNYDVPDETELVSAWRALPQVIQSTKKGSGLVAEWQQRRGTLLVSGDVKSVKLWDVATELVSLEIPTRSGSCVTSLTSDQIGGDIFVAGFGDGAVRVYDKRNPPREAMVMAYKESSAWIVNVKMQSNGNRELVSASVSGDIKVWDIRESRSLWTIEGHKADLTALAVHDYAPVFASGSGKQQIKIWNMHGLTLNTIGHYTGFLGQKISAVRGLAFHPHHLLMAAGGSDGYVMLTKGNM